jgi:hypothetical protein
LLRWCESLYWAILDNCRIYLPPWFAEFLRKHESDGLSLRSLLILRTEAAQPVRYKFDKTVTYVTSDGKVIEASKIRKDSKVRVHYIKNGDDMLVDKVIVTQDRD